MHFAIDRWGLWRLNHVCIKSLSYAMQQISNHLDGSYVVWMSMQISCSGSVDIIHCYIMDVLTSVI